MKEGHRAVAIDGPAASGKSTVACRIADRLGLVMVNSGAMYRAVTWQILQDGVVPSDAAAVIEALTKMEIEGGVEDGVSTIAINGRRLDDEVRSPGVNDHVSEVASIPEVRECLVAMQRAYLENNDVVMEGRDIGSVVFPDTSNKFYIDASPEVREQRRRAEGIDDSIAARDKIDSNRKASPLVIPEDATVVDSSDLSIEEVVEKVKKSLVS